MIVYGDSCVVVMVVIMVVIKEYLLTFQIIYHDINYDLGEKYQLIISPKYMKQ